MTNVQLFKWGMRQDNMCSFCSLEVETMSHLFYHCTIVKELWSKIIDFAQEKYMSPIWDLSVKNVILDSVVQPRSHLMNFLCLMTKQFIYKQRCLKQELHFPIWLAHLRVIEKLRKVYCHKKREVGTT